MEYTQRYTDHPATVAYWAEIASLDRQYAGLPPDAWHNSEHLTTMAGCRDAYTAAKRRHIETLAAAGITVTEYADAAGHYWTDLCF